MVFNLEGAIFGIQSIRGYKLVFNLVGGKYGTQSSRGYIWFSI